MEPLTPLTEKCPIVWINGKFMAWAEASIHPASNSLCYASAPFDGLRLYHGADQEAFLTYAHSQRNIDGCKAFDYPTELKYSKEDIAAAMIALAKLNVPTMEIPDIYVRTTAWLDDGDISVGAQGGKPGFAITLHPIASHPVDQRLMLSSHRRANESIYPVNTKSSPIFAGSQAAMREAQRAGFTAALMLDQEGNIADCDIANLLVFYEVNGEIVMRTPEPKHVLDGFTIQVLERLCDNFGIRRERCTVALDDLDNAIAAMMCGTAKEVCIVTEIGANANEPHPKRPLPPFDGVTFPGHPVTKKLQDAYNDLVRAPVKEQFEILGWTEGDDGPFLGPVTQEVLNKADELFEENKHLMAANNKLLGVN